MNRLSRIKVDIARFIQYGDLPTSYYKKRGMSIGKNFNRQSNTKFDPSHCWLVEIGDDVTISNGVLVLAHDDSTREYLLFGKVGRVIIKNRVFIGANTTVLPNVTIGSDCIIGAGSVVSRSIPEGCVAVGNPAKVICTTEEYIKKNQEYIDNGAPIYDLAFSIYGDNNANNKERMKKELIGKIGYQKLWKHTD